MKRKVLLDELIRNYPELSELRDSIDKVSGIIVKCYTAGGKLLICGNGGSSSDSCHIAGELMKSFERERPLDVSLKNRLADISADRGKYLADKLEHGLPAISLSAHSSLITAICNDIDPQLIFAQQILGYGEEKDVLLAISTSGNSENIIDACITARAMNMTVVGMTGRSGGKMKEYCDILINVPREKTASVQEIQLPVYHTICRIVEEYFYGGEQD
ncbi:MAG: SIS domain-containing protein [Bacteroidales bacterium]|nr:SIS domain-containing protein [Bacteroidales bacterium]